MSNRVDRRRRAEEYIDRFADEELVGLLFHPMVLLDASHDPEAPGVLGPSTRELIVDRGIRHICLGGIPSPAETAEILGGLQELATSHGTRLPITFSTDPRHSFLQNPGATHRADGVSQWPEPIGLGAIDDPALVAEFGRIVRRDYRAMGIRMALHPQVDLATEPRWARQAQSFGTDPELTARLLRAFLEGLQGEELTSTSVAATVKHFPGGGPQLDGEDPHFPYGREQVYPGGRFEDHLLPFRVAVEAGAAAIMPYYGMPVDLDLNGQKVEPVGFAFNRRLITELLREEMQFDGVVLSDFGLITDANVFGKPFPARAWGVEHLDASERMARLFSAGVDQLGGESDTSGLLRLLDEGKVDRARFRDAAARVVALTLDLFPDAVVSEVPDLGELQSRESIELGQRAQSRAITVLHVSDTDETALPLSGPRRVHLVDVDAAALPEGWVAATVEEAEFALVRLSAPFEARDHFFLEASMEQGSLEFPADVVDGIAALGARLPVLLAVTLSRPAILTPLLPYVTTVVADFGASDEALIAALTGKVIPEGRLPFELPRSMEAVRASQPDAGSDTADPLFPIGAGLALASR
jgi:beta-glucosidase